MNKMNKLLKDKNCKEYLLIFNTPGGSPSASDEFNAYLKYINKKKRVNVYVESMAASGGYYIISAIKPIVANKNAIVGSIGVIMPHYVIKKLADKLGIEEDTITVGKYKEPISWFRKLSPKDREYLKTHLLLPTYENFLKTVAKDRNISVDKLKKYADGKIYVATLVKGILVDKISSLTAYENEIKKRLGKKVEFVPISLEKRKVPFFNIKLSSDVGEALKEVVGIVKQ
jgi:protease-4